MMKQTPVKPSGSRTRLPVLLLVWSALLTPCAVLSMSLVSGCSKPPPPPPPPPPRRAAAPPPPEKVAVDGILQTMRVDARVQFPQGAAPTDESLARAVISFAD